MIAKLSFLAISAMLVSAGLFAYSFVNAAPPKHHADGDAPGHQHAALERLTVVSGKIADWTTNKPGDVDGFRLDSQALVHFPPHHGDAMQEWLKPDEAVTVFAKPKSRSDGGEVMEAVIIQSGDTAMHVPGPAPKPEPKSRPTTDGHKHEHEHEHEHEHDAKKPEPPMSARGKITSLQENQHGDVDGLVIDEETEVKFPPHMGLSVLASVQVGSEVVVDGRRHETPKGEIHLHADKIASGDTVIEIERPEPKPHDEKEAGKGMHKQGKEPHEQIVDELRKIRELLESQGN